ncbi:hypothetical protein DERP_014005 [Dermatophagoides pteronyssinus]|uniref:Uncharacterized protein n=1 Tax=Dermatophagoides pteronyssinus TaxID=6956 RepID=A0ABQ8JDF8_DERPT|nr:hypothetical protein DERP_014005 [Dermatophagoides pteronyssinus]
MYNSKWNICGLMIGMAMVMVAFVRVAFVRVAKGMSTNGITNGMSTNGMLTNGMTTNGTILGSYGLEIEACLCLCNLSLPRFLELVLECVVGYLDGIFGLINGMATNGITNGMSTNGMSTNGMSTNGMSNGTILGSYGLEIEACLCLCNLSLPRFLELVLECVVGDGFGFEVFGGLSMGK